MHSLLPDKIEVRKSSSDSVIKTVELGDIIFEKGTGVTTTVPLDDLFYSLGVGHAGRLAVSLHRNVVNELLNRDVV